jgi:transcriptional regulator with XRE-family HTH domain
MLQRKNKMYGMTIPELLEKKYLEWQSQLGKRKTLDEFAEYLGVSRTVLSNWLSGNRKPGTESLRLLSSKLGFEVYDVLGLPRPDEDLAYIYHHWDELPEAYRHKFRKELEEFLKNEDAKRFNKPRRAKANS